MGTIYFFMMTSLDGYYEGPNHDIQWHHVDQEFNEFAIKQLKEMNTLLFGRVTYQLMASYWPTQQGLTDDPIVAKLMNEKPKVVFSKTLREATWQNTRLVQGDPAKELKALKQQGGKMIIFGSSDLATSLLEHDLIDEIRVMVAPVILGAGKPVFLGLKERVKLKLLGSKTFHSGNVLLRYSMEK